MTPNRRQFICRLTALSITLSASGCFVPGGGWTMRTGIDLRRYKKPSAFVELVDTRWDEYNRVAEMNTLTVPIGSPAAFTPSAGPGLMEGISVPPASDPSSTPPEPRFPGNSNGSNSTGDEPSRLPGAADAPTQTPTQTPRRDAPTARRSALDGPSTPTSSTDNSATDVTAASASATTPAAKTSRRPMASRLFSRPQ